MCLKPLHPPQLHKPLQVKSLINRRKFQVFKQFSTNQLLKNNFRRKFKTAVPRFRNQKVFARVVLSSAVFIIVYFTSNKEKTTTLAGIKEMLSLREHKVDCSPESYSSCMPSKCGRFASDNVISETELEKLRELTMTVFNKFFKNDDESSLSFDLHSESLTKHEALSKNIEEVFKVRNFLYEIMKHLKIFHFSRFNQNSSTQFLIGLRLLTIPCP